MTISEAMVLQKSVRERINDLSTIRSSNLVEKRVWDMFDGGKEKQRTEITPKYDPRVVDKKITSLQTVLFKLDAAIKMANAQAVVNITVDIDDLFAPIE